MQHAHRTGLIQYKKGEDVYAAKLTTAEVIAIKAELRLKKFTQRQIAVIYGVNFRTINGIATGRNWKHLQ